MTQINYRYEKIFDTNLGGTAKRGTQSVTFSVIDKNDNDRK
jgi:hypothetical protein